MLPLKKRQLWARAPVISLAAFLLAVIFLSLPAQASSHSAGAGPSAPGAQDFSLPPAGQALKAPASKSGEIYQLDSSPLLARKPLLLVHGGSGERKPLCRWGTVIDYLQSSESFRNRFKIYLYRYDSKKCLSETVPPLRHALERLSQACDGAPITVVALSMGGNLMQGALLDAKTDSLVEKVLAMGTPFHGSPLFSPDWFQYSLDRSKILPWARAVHGWDYRFFFQRHLNYLEDLKWDNADLLIPEVGKFHSLVPIGPRGDLTVRRDGNPMLAEINKASHRQKHKFITYAGYIHNPYLMPAWRRRLESTILAPYAFFRIRIMAHLGREHAALKWLNREMSQLHVNTRVTTADPSAYKLNDGITPVNSAVWLPADVVSRCPVLDEAALKDLDELTDVRLARVFKHVDHVSFMDGKPPKGNDLLADEVHPEEGRKPLLEWVLSDIVNDESKKTPLSAGDLPANAPVNRP